MPVYNHKIYNEAGELLCSYVSESPTIKFTRPLGEISWVKETDPVELVPTEDVPLRRIKATTGLFDDTVIVTWICPGRAEDMVRNFLQAPSGEN